MTSSKVVAYWPVNKNEFPDLDWKPVDDTDDDPERAPYHKQYEYQALMPTSDARFQQAFRLNDPGGALTETARKVREDIMRETLIQEGLCALLFSK